MAACIQLLPWTGRCWMPDWGQNRAMFDLDGKNIKRPGGVPPHRQGQGHISAKAHERLHCPGMALRNCLVQGRRTITVYSIHRYTMAAAQHGNRLCVAADCCQVQRAPPTLAETHTEIEIVAACNGVQRALHAI